MEVGIIDSFTANQLFSLVTLIVVILDLQKLVSSRLMNGHLMCKKVSETKSDNVCRVSCNQNCAMSLGWPSWPVVNSLW